MKKLGIEFLSNSGFNIFVSFEIELEAYSSVVTALRAQGELTKERRKIMNDLSNVLNIPIERHKAEVRRAVNDELLNTIAVSLCGNGQNEAEWAKEGRRIIPLLKRATPITAFTPIADEGSEKLTNLNKSLNSPLNTKSEPKRRCLSPAYAMKYSNRTPPKDLRELVHKVKEEHNEGTFLFQLKRIMKKYSGMYKIVEIGTVNLENFSSFSAMLSENSDSSLKIN